MPAMSSARFMHSYLKMRHLVLLAELGRHGSISQAARAAKLNQPAASKLLSDLESALGIPLFERLPLGVRPTAQGQVLIRRATASLAEMDAAFGEVAALQDSAAGSVAVGAILTPAGSLVPRAVGLLKARYPRVSVSIEVNISERLIDRLCTGDLHIAIGRVPDVAVADELHFEPIGDEPHCVVVRPGHPLLALPGGGLEDLAGQAWVLPPKGSVLRDRLHALFLSQGLALPFEGVSALAPALVASLLMGSDMIAPMSTALAQPYIDHGMLAALPVDLDVRMDVYGVITRRKHILHPGAERMLDALREAAGMLPRPALVLKPLTTPGDHAACFRAPSR